MRLEASARYIKNVVHLPGNGCNQFDRGFRAFQNAFAESSNVQQLREKNLCQGCNLKQAILRGAYLSGANLVKANLQESDLKDVNLVKADLRRANLKNADLRGANLRGANLQGVNLWGANLKNKVAR